MFQIIQNYLIYYFKKPIICNLLFECLNEYLSNNQGVYGVAHVSQMDKRYDFIIILFYYSVYFNVVKTVIHYYLSYNNKVNQYPEGQSQGDIRNMFGIFLWASLTWN